MRIGFLTSWEERCGIAEYSRRLIEALRVAEPRLEVEVVPARFGRRPRSHYRDLAQALNRCDAAHVQHSYAFFGGMHPLRSGWPAFAEALKTPTLITVHEWDESPGVWALGGLTRLYKAAFNRTVLHPAAVRAFMVHAEPIAAALRRSGVPEGRITCLPLPIAEAGPADPEPLRARLGLTGRRALVIPGFLSRRKGYETALAALGRLPEEVVLVAAGGEHAADRTGTASWLRAEAARLGLGNRLYITGYLCESDLEAAVQMADVVLAPFRDMSASASVNLALARGKAVVASDLPPLRALGCVRLFPAGDDAALADSVQCVQENPGVRAELEGAARGYAQRHTYAGLAATTASHYRSLLENPMGNTDSYG